MGKFLAIDFPTLTCTQSHYAHVCVELDLAQPRPNSVRVVQEGGGLFTLPIINENIPGYCEYCRLLGHNFACLKGLVLNKRRNMKQVDQMKERNHQNFWREVINHKRRKEKSNNGFYWIWKRKNKEVVDNKWEKSIRDFPSTSRIVPIAHVSKANMTRSAVNIHKRGIIKCNMKLKLMRRFMILLQHNNIRKKNLIMRLLLLNLGRFWCKRKLWKPLLPPLPQTKVWYKMKSRKLGTQKLQIKLMIMVLCYRRASENHSPKTQDAHIVTKNTLASSSMEGDLDTEAPGKLSMLHILWSGYKLIWT